MTNSQPSKLGRYEIVDELGRGAMGIVYRARDPLIGREVAIKTFRIGYSVRDEEMDQFRRRFIREAQSAGILSHPNIVTIHDVVEHSDEGVSFIAMEYVPGTTLKQVLQPDRPVDHEFAVDVVGQIASALDYAHAKGVVHRDIKPANILITQDRRVKITDFGIARLNTSNLTQDGQLLGTPNYMAPEQILGKEIDQRADIFAMGVLLYELLTRHKPFTGENLTTVTHRVVYEPFTPPEQHAPGLPAGFAAVLNKALEKDPEKRYQKAGELAADLKAALVRARLDESAETVSVPRFKPPVAAAAPASPAAAEVTAPTGRTGSEPTLETTAPAVPAAGVAAAKAAGAKKGGPPWALIAAGAAAAVIAAGAGLWLMNRKPPPPPEVVAPVTPANQTPEYLAAIASGQAKLLARDFSGAAAAFAEAERLAPGDESAASLRAEAERQATQTVEAAAPPPVAPVPAAPRPPVVAAAPAPSAPVAPVPAAPAPSSPKVPANRAELLVDFQTEISPGTVTVYVGRDQVLREPFRFTRRAGLRTTSVPGGWTATRAVMPGDNALRVIVSLEGRPTRVINVQGNFRGGSSRSLVVRVDAAGEATASLK
jgi:serine/threonine-protein kinase